MNAQVVSFDTKPVLSSVDGSSTFAQVESHCFFIFCFYLAGSLPALMKCHAFVFCDLRRFSIHLGSKHLQGHRAGWSNDKVFLHSFVSALTKNNFFGML